MEVVKGKSSAIPIPQGFLRETKCNSHLFDPFKSSPPNDFMKKLHKRMGELEVKIEIKRTSQ